MRLKQLIKSAGINHRGPLKDLEVKGISSDSRNIKDGFIFAAVRGANIDGHRFIGEAVRKGAKAVILQSHKSQVTSQKEILFISVKDTRKALGRLAAEFYGNPSDKIKVVGITGTNGKTTVSYLIEAILKEAGLDPAVIGTVNYRFKNKVIPSTNTTPGPVQLQAFLSEMVKKSIGYAVMEASSHALDQDRTAGIDFYSAVFTNLTQDHLDYHFSIRDYFRAKSKLFSGMKSGAFGVINNDDRYARQLSGLSRAKLATYGIEKKSDVMAEVIDSDISYTKLRIVKAAGPVMEIKTGLIGRHNVYNILAAVAWALEEGLDPQVISSGIAGFPLVPGRLERVGAAGDFSIFVDYAHTHDALKNVIRALRQLSRGNIIVVFGCGGERDKTKRPKMGKVVCELADYAIITNDNPRSEDPQNIFRDISKGIGRNNYSVIPDRFQAIKKSLNIAGKGDIVLVAGKGHEDYQVLKEGKIHFDDRQVIRECLRSMNS